MALRHERNARKDSSDKSKIPRASCTTLKFESLEQRLVLSGDPITDVQRDALLAGLDAPGTENDLAGWLERLSSGQPINTPLAVTNQSIGEQLDPAEALRLGFIQPLAGWLSPLDTQTDQDLVAFLNDDLRDGIVGVYDLEILSAEGGLNAGTLAFDVVLRATRSDLTFTAEFGPAAGEQALQIANTAAVGGLVDYTLDFGFTLGVDEQDQFFAIVQQLEMSAEVEEVAAIQATNPAPAAGSIASAVDLRLVINGDEIIHWSVPAEANLGQTDELAAAMTTQLAAALAPTPYAGDVVVEDRAGMLAILSTSGKITSLELNGGEILGFAPDARGTGPLAADAALGFLDVDIVGGALRVDASVNTQVDHGADGHLSTADLGASSADIAAQVVHVTSGEAAATLPVIPKLDGTLIAGDPLLSVTSTDLFDSGSLTISRVDLSQVDAINDQASAAIKMGLAALQDFADGLDETGDMAATLSLLGLSLGESVDLGELIERSIVDTVASYLQSVSVPTREGLEAALAGMAGTFDELTILSPTVSSQTSDDGSELRWNVAWRAERLLALLPELGPGGDSLALEFESLAAGLTAFAEFDLSFIVDLARLPDEADAFYIEFGVPLVAGLEVNPIPGAARGSVGVLGVAGDLSDLAGLCLGWRSSPPRPVGDSAFRLRRCVKSYPRRSRILRESATCCRLLFRSQCRPESQASPATSR